MNSRNRELQIAAACVFALAPSLLVAEPFTFDDIDFWVGNGANRAALAIDGLENNDQPPALVWGYRWDGTASGRDMLLAVVEADDRLFAKLGEFFGVPVVYGLGYDADADGQFGAMKIGLDGEPIETVFDESGISVSEIPDDDGRRATATDPGDYYMEGWFTGFWHYGNEAHDPPGTPTNPFDGGSWVENGSSIATRSLVDGSWDSWAFEMPAFPPPFTAYAVNPLAAASPFPPGDYNRDYGVDTADYQLWKSEYGSTIHPAVDGNRNGSVDAADYVVWRNNLGTGTPSSATQATGVPEPSTLWLAMCSACALGYFLIVPRKGESS
jgi:hypothetical protein